MNETLTLTFGIAGFVVAALVIIGISVAIMTRESAQTASINQKFHQPITNGLAVPALVIIGLIFVLTLVLGFVPPLLRSR